MPAATSVDAVEIYLEFRPLLPACRPAWVTRHDGATMLTIDPRTTCKEASLWVADNLRPDELDAYRIAYGGPPVGQVGPEYWSSDRLVDSEPPPSLRLVTEMEEARTIHLGVQELRSKAASAALLRWLA